MEEKVEWEVEIRCEHSYDRRCARTLKTNYKPFQVSGSHNTQTYHRIYSKFLSLKDIVLQEEICQENYVKNCFIEYQKTAENVTVTVCRVPLVKDCDSNEEQVSGTVVFPALNFQFNF